MRAGGCLCGAVRFETDVVPETYIVCHCEMCRRWTGAALLGVTVPSDTLRWSGTEHVAERVTSGWGKRAWCKECGTGLYLQSTLDDDDDQTELLLGLFDDPNGLRPSHEIWFDRKTDSFAFADMGQEHRTRAECIAKMPFFDAGDSADKEFKT